MIVFVPVSRYRVQYQAATGRPYSGFEQMILRALSADGETLEGLISIFRVHRRVLIEGLVTLMRAGWVALEPEREGIFVLTEAGKSIGRLGKELPNVINVGTRTETVVMERVTGQVARSGDVKYHPKARLTSYMAGNSSLILPKADIANTVEPGMVAGLLRRYENEWIRWIGPIDIIRDNADYVLMKSDNDWTDVTGVPDHWIDSLVGVASQIDKEAAGPDGAEIERELEKAGYFSRRDAGGGARRVWNLQSSSVSFVVGEADHRDRIRTALDSANSQVTICSADVSDDHIRSLLPAIEEALARGVDLHVLIGSHPVDYGDGNGKSALKALGKLGYDSSRNTESGSFVFNRLPTGSRANILVSDSNNGKLTAVVGSYVWLGQPPGRPSFSVEIMHPGATSEVLRLMADMSYRSAELSRSPSMVRLANIAAQLENMAINENLDLTDSEAAEGRLELLFDFEAAVKLVHVSNRARGSCFIAGLRSDLERDGTVLDEIRNAGATITLYGLGGAVAAAPDAGGVNGNDERSSGPAEDSIDSLFLADADTLLTSSGGLLGKLRRAPGAHRGDDIGVCIELDRGRSSLLAGLERRLKDEYSL